MAFSNIKEAAWFEDMGDDDAPGRQIGEPADDSIRGIDDIKLSGERMWRIVEIGVDKRRVQPSFFSERPAKSNGIPLTATE